MMKKMTTMFAMLLLAASAVAQVTVEWNTAPIFEPNDNASVYYVGITTPGTPNATYTMTAFSFYENSGYGADSVYTVISKTAPSAENGWIVYEEDVLGISDDCPQPTEEGFVNYTIAGSEGAILQGGTTYYMVFVKSNETNGGAYEVGTQRVRLQLNQDYTASVCLGNGVIRHDLLPAFKATLTTNNAFKVTWKAISQHDNQPFDQGVADVVGSISVPTYEYYRYSHTTLADGTEFDVKQEITENTEVIFYYNPLIDIEYIIRSEKGEDLAYKMVQEVWSTTVTQLPAELDQSHFYDYSEINFKVESETTIEVTATQKKEPLVLFNEDESGTLTYNHLALKGSNYLYYSDGDHPNVNLSNPLQEDETSEWAFIGNPYEGFKIKNRAAGSNMVLGSEDPRQDTNTGGETYATLGESQYYELWFPKPSTHATNGFYLFNKDGVALNLRNDKVAYWTGGYDAGSTFVATKVLSGAEKIANARQVLAELTAGTSEVKIGYPTPEALAEFEAAINEITEAYNGGGLEEGELSTQLNEAIENVKSAVNAVYEPRTDVYYTITNTRGSVVYNPERTEDVDGNGNEFLWYTNALNKDSLDHQWGFYRQGDEYYLYNVGKKLFASVTKKAAEGKTIFSSGCWIFSKVPAKVTLDGGNGDWVAIPNVRIQGDALVTDEYDDEYEDTYTMSISPSYTGPVITYYADGDGGVPMTFALAATALNPEVTAAIEALLDPSGIETVENGQAAAGNGAIYNLQGQKVTKAVKGVFIQNGKKVVVK